MSSSRGIRKLLRAVSLNAVLLATSCTVGALLGESVVRLVAPQQLILIRPDIWQPADTVGWLHRPNVNTSINTGEHTIHVFTDHEGLRVGSQGRTTARRRILLLGDSFMEALQMEYEESFAGRLAAELPRHVGDSVGVRNAAISGWESNQYFLRAHQLLKRDTFGLVITAIYMDNNVVRERLNRVPPRTPVARHKFSAPTHPYLKRVHSRRARAAQRHIG